MTKISIGECPVCRQGQLLIVKDTRTGNLLVMCDDCGSQWKSPELAASYETVMKDEVNNVVDPSPEEVEAYGWRDFSASLG